MPIFCGLQAATVAKFVARPQVRATLSTQRHHNREMLVYARMPSVVLSLQHAICTLTTVI